MKNKIYLILIPILLLAILLLYFFLPITPQRKLIKYANDNYGKAKYIDYKKENETATFLDKEYGFTYTVTSYIDTFNIDGSSFGSYEAKKDTYTKSFISYIKDITQNEFSNIQNKYNCTLEWNPHYSSKTKDDVLIYVNLRDSNFCKDITTSIGKLIENIDTRNHFNKAIIYGRYNEEFIGKYSLTTQSYFNSTDSNINWAMESAYTIMKTYKNIPINSIEEITYISSQRNSWYC